MIAKLAKLATNLVSKMMLTWLYRQDFAKFSLNCHYNINAYCNVTSPKHQHLVGFFVDPTPTRASAAATQPLLTSEECSSSTGR
ncbi:hypothetical protein TNCV_3251011 [Trichonephila clavipes]|nr:hypothetical protein TNCV_3251011 [Trichonephila clavipes]